jgi:hypothetical protein
VELNAALSGTVPRCRSGSFRLPGDLLGTAP